MQLTTAAITSTLEVHGVRARVLEGRVQAWEEATVRDESGAFRDASAWVQVPTTRSGLARWLGY